MKNIYEVIRQKEQEITELQRQIEALRTAARLLADDHDTSDTYPARPTSAAAPAMPARPPAVAMAGAAAAGALKEFP